MIETIVECMGQPTHSTAYRMHGRELESQIKCCSNDNREFRNSYIWPLIWELNGKGKQLMMMKSCCIPGYGQIAPGKPGGGI